MFGSLKQFIDIELPPIQQDNVHTTQQQQNQEEEDDEDCYDYNNKRTNKLNSFLNSKKDKAKTHEGRRGTGTGMEKGKGKRSINQPSSCMTMSNVITSNYEPSNKEEMLKKFNRKTGGICGRKSRNNNNGANCSMDQIKQYSNTNNKMRKPLCHRISFFTKGQITKDYIAKQELKRKHNLLRAIIRTNQNQNSNDGVSDYDQSFKRMYEKFHEIYAKPIIGCRNFVIDQNQHPIPTPINIPLTNKPVSSLNNKKRIEYQNCLSWARKHKKNGDFYAEQLGKSACKNNVNIKAQKLNRSQVSSSKLNVGHLMMGDLQRRIKSFSVNY